MTGENSRAEFLHRLCHLRKFSRDGRKALHKPVLLLFAFAELKNRNVEMIRYRDAVKVITPILEKFGVSSSRSRAADPFTRLVGDGIWQIKSANHVDLFDASGNGRPGALLRHNVEAGFDAKSLRLLKTSPGLIDEAADIVARHHLPEDVRELVLRMVGWSRTGQ